MNIELDYLLTILKSYYNNKVPKATTTTIDDIRIMQGQQQVIDFIQGIKDKEERGRSENSKSKSARR